MRSTINEVLEECDDMEIDEAEIDSHLPSNDNACSGLPWDDAEDEMFMKWVENEMLNELSNIPHLDFIDAEDEELIRMIGASLLPPETRLDTRFSRTGSCTTSHMSCLRRRYNSA